MDILNVIDQEDGSCIMECNFSEEEINFFLSYAVNDILKIQFERMKNEHGPNWNNGALQSDETLESEDL
jgi:hypothetical protein